MKFNWIRTRAEVCMRMQNQYYADWWSRPSDASFDTFSYNVIKRRIVKFVLQNSAIRRVEVGRTKFAHSPDKLSKKLQAGSSSLTTSCKKILVRFFIRDSSNQALLTEQNLQRFKLKRSMLIQVNVNYLGAAGIGVTPCNLYRRTGQKPLNFRNSISESERPKRHY